jgi:S-adenosylmethionine:tRNA ribosyltransferase-isomerase
MIYKKLSDFDYHLPEELIAQAPVSPRDHSRLLVLDKISGRIEHKHFYDIVDYLQTGDVLVLNNSKVFPARLIGRRKISGGKLEIFLLKKSGGNVWKCLVGGRRARAGLGVEFAKGLEARLIKNNNDGTWEAGFNLANAEMMKIVEEIGEVPLPPYIKKEKTLLRQGCGGQGKQKIDHRRSYQTVYADDDKLGSVAAPTAGLHFTQELMKKIKEKGVQIEYVTLHVGLGTFAPVKVDDITGHKMHEEYVEVRGGTVKRIQEAKKENRRLIAVGTTSARILESMADDIGNPKSPVGTSGPIRDWKLEIGNLSGWTDIFIYPGYEFKMVDGMITNFHLPKSTLLMLVSALAGKKNIDKAYQEAIREKYRFYSYGDAMFIS